MRNCQFQNFRVLIFFSCLDHFQNRKRRVDIFRENAESKMRKKRSEPSALEVSISRILVWTNFLTVGLDIFFVFLALFSDFFSEVSILTPFFRISFLNQNKFSYFFFSFLTTILILKHFFCFSNTAFILCYLWSWPFIFWSWNPFSFFSLDHFFFQWSWDLFFSSHTKFLS